MADSTTVTVRLARGTRKRLDALARTTKRSKSFIAGEAIGIGGSSENESCSIEAYAAVNRESIAQPGGMGSLRLRAR